MIGNLRGQAVVLSLSSCNSFDLGGGITPGGKSGHPLAFHDIQMHLQVHLDCLAVEIQRLLTDHLGPIGKILLRLLHGGAAEIAQSMLLEIVRKSFQRLFIAPGRADTVDPAIILVVMPACAQGYFLRNGMFSLRPGGSKTWHTSPPCCQRNAALFAAASLANSGNRFR